MSFISQHKKDLKKLKNYLKGKGVKKEEDLYKLLIDKHIPNSIKFLVYNQIRKNEHLFDIKELSKILKLPEMAIKKIFKTEPIEVKFPIALNKKSKLASAYIIPLNKPIEKNSFPANKDIEDGLKTIKTLIRNKDLPVKDFFVIFDEDFTGKSFMLSVFAGLTLPEYALKNFIFTGVLNEEGEIFPVDYIKEKETLAKKKNLKLLTPYHLDNVDELIYYLGTQQIDIPFVFLIKRPEGEEKLALQKIELKIKEKSPLFSIEKLNNIFDIKEEDLFINNDEFLPEITFDDIEKENQWIKQIQLFQEKLQNIYSKFSYKNRILHIGLAVPSSLAMGLGIKLGTKKPVVIYHYQSDEYIPVIDLSDKKKLRKIKYIRKDIYKNLKNIEVFKPTSLTKDTAVAIWLASHNLYNDVQNYLKQKKLNFSLLKIESKAFQGDIPLPEDFEDIDKDYWIRYISEIYSVLNILKNKENIERFHFFISTPVALAFGLGMAIGHFWDGIIYNFSFKGQEKYYPVFKINDTRLRSIF